MTEQTFPEYILKSGDDYAITLSKTYDIAGAKVSTITMREPTVQDLLAADLQTKGQSDAWREITMFANLCATPPDNIKVFGLRDYKRIQEAYRLFTV